MITRNSIVLWFVVTTLVVFAQSTASRPAVKEPAGLSRDTIVRTVAQIQRADYEGDRDALKRLYGDLSPVPEEKKLASRVLYWRGFALWRRATNGFNDTDDPKAVGEDLEQAINEFNDAIAKDPDLWMPRLVPRLV